MPRIIACSLFLLTHSINIFLNHKKIKLQTANRYHCGVYCPTLRQITNGSNSLKPFTCQFVIPLMQFLFSCFNIFFTYSYLFYKMCPYKFLSYYSLPFFNLMFSLFSINLGEGVAESLIWNIQYILVL